MAGEYSPAGCIVRAGGTCGWGVIPGDSRIRMAGEYSPAGCAGAKCVAGEYSPTIASLGHYDPAIIYDPVRSVLFRSVRSVNLTRGSRGRCPKRPRETALAPWLKSFFTFNYIAPYSQVAPAERPSACMLLSTQRRCSLACSVVRCLHGATVIELVHLRSHFGSIHFDSDLRRLSPCESSTN